MWENGPLIHNESTLACANGLMGKSNSCPFTLADWGTVPSPITQKSCMKRQRCGGRIGPHFFFVSCVLLLFSPHSTFTSEWLSGFWAGEIAGGGKGADFFLASHSHPKKKKRKEKRGRVKKAKVQHKIEMGRFFRLFRLAV